jgi:sugar O-acyltransferase (sialic acid O-acetyltransferase NeuD family)
MERLLIFPCNGNGREAVECLGPGFLCLGFVDDTAEKVGTTVLGLPVLDRVAFARHPDARVLAVPGSPSSYRDRQAVIDGLGLPAERYARVIHPGAHVSAHARTGHNLLVMAGAVITSNATIGSHVVILPNSVVHHDAEIGDFTLVGSNVSVAGGVVVEENCYLGTGAQILSGLRIGKGAMVGLGSTVIRPVEAGSRHAGNPARRLP